MYASLHTALILTKYIIPPPLGFPFPGCLVDESKFKFVTTLVAW